MARNVESSVHDPPLGRAGGRDRAAAPVSIKVRGTRDGLVLSVPPDARAVPAREVAAALAVHLDGAEAFFSGAEVVIDLGEREVGEEEVDLYRRVLEEREVLLRGFSATGARGRAILRKGGYHPLQVAAETGREPRSAEAMEALYLRRTLRSGTRVRHHGHLVVVGDINAGAEAVASGDIVVWGVARGTVHAGALGDESAIICALGLNPTQLRIGSHYALPPSEGGGKTQGRRGPERVRLEGGQLIVEPWKR